MPEILFFQLIKDSITEPLSLYFPLMQLKGKMINYIIVEVIYANW